MLQKLVPFVSKRLKTATWLLFARISEFYSAAVEGRSLRSTGELTLCNILRPNSASTPPSNETSGLLVCEKNVAISSSLTGGRPSLSDSQVFTPPNGCKNKKARKYNVKLFAGRPLERGMGFVDDAEQLCSVRTLVTYCTRR